MTTSFRTSQRLARVKPSITMAVTAKAAELRAKGVDVISFGAGEPDFDTPDHIKAAAHKGLDTGVAKYTHVAGLVGFREAIASHLGGVHGISLTSDQIIVSTGAKHSLFNLFMAMIDEGDEVIIPAPYWVSYPDMVKIAGGNPVIIPTTAEDGFQLDPAALSAAITDKTRALVINTPCNPTGALYTRERLEAIAKIAVERGIYVISDDIYRSLVYGGRTYTSIASLGADIAAQTILIDGVSKTYAMTGWRIGYTAGPVELIKAMSKLQGQSTSNPSHISQVAAQAAITGPQDCVAEMREAFDARRRTMVSGLNAIDGVTCREPHGAFYAFPDLSAFVGKKTADGTVLADDIELCVHLLEAGNVALVPGTGFGAPGYARLSYATSMDNIEKGIERLSAALGALS